MNKRKKTVSVLLAVCMVFSAMSLIAFAADKKNSITIFIDGINSEDIVDAETGEKIYPADGGRIGSAVVRNIPAILKSLVTGRHQELIGPAGEIVDSIFGPIGVDENGVPPANTRFNYTWPTAEEIRAFAASTDPGKRLKYAFDWRLDMQTIAAGLHDFIEYAMEASGADSVALIACSMGSCALLSYLRMYDYEYVDSAIILVGAVNGTSCCGEPFSGHVGFNSDSIVRYVDSVLGFDLGSVILTAFLHGINAMGLMDPVVKQATKLVDELNDAVYDQIFSETFNSFPGMWALVPFEMYEDAKALAGNSISDTLMERIDWYHYEVQAHAEDIMRGCLERDIRMGIIAKYGYPSIPCIESADAMSDTIIDTKYESFGAVCADTDGTLGDDYTQAVDNGHDCISPDRLIDSSTCTFCDYTWFIKNSKHADSFGASAVICNFIIDSDRQVTVWDDPSLPQYLILENDMPVPLTAENADVLYTVNIKDENVFTVFWKMLQSFRKLIKDFFDTLFAKFR